MTVYLKMTKKDLNKCKILQWYLDEKIPTQEEASKLIWIWERQFRRMLKRYKKLWEGWIIHKSRWKESNRRLSKEKEEEIKSICMEPEYYDFWPTLMKEKLGELYDIKISIEKLRQIMIKIWLRKVKERKEYKQYTKRQRRSNEWDLIQFDWSYHKRLENRNGWIIDCLLLAIDDATWKIMHIKFDDNEWKEAVFNFWKEYAIKHWIPREIYLDKFSTYKNNYPKATYEPDVPTEFWRVCSKLWIKLISAHSPQAKWRVERWNKTLQDRLVKEMRLEWINDVKRANKYLERFVEVFNYKFWKQPNWSLNLHRELTKEENEKIDWIFSKHAERTVNNDYTISYNTNYYQLYKKSKYWLHPKVKIKIQEKFNWDMRILFRDKEIEFKEIETRPISYNKNLVKKVEIIVNEESVNQKKQEKRKQEEQAKKRKKSAKEKKDKKRFDNSKERQRRYNYFKNDLKSKWLSWAELHREASRMAVSNTI